MVNLFKWSMDAYASDLKSSVKDKYETEFMAKIDTDHDGKINLKEFTNLFQEFAGMIAVLRVCKRADELHEWDSGWDTENHRHLDMLTTELGRYRDLLSELNQDAAPFNESYDTVSRIECIRLQGTIRDLHKKHLSSDFWNKDIKVHQNILRKEQEHIEEEIRNIEEEQRGWRIALEKEDRLVMENTSTHKSSKTRASSKSPSMSTKNSAAGGSRSTKGTR